MHTKRKINVSLLLPCLLICYNNLVLSPEDSDVQSSLTSRGQGQGNPYESAVITYNSTTFYIDCLFHDMSNASACVGVYWKNSFNLYGLVNVDSIKFDRNGNKSHGHINVESEGYHIAVFAFSSNRNVIYGEPLDVSYYADPGIVNSALYHKLNVLWHMFQLRCYL